MGLEWLAAFDQVDLLQFLKIAKEAGAKPLRAGIATLTALELAKKSSAPAGRRNQRSRSRPNSHPRCRCGWRAFPACARRHGRVELLVLKATARSNVAFGRAVRRAGFDLPASFVTKAMQVAKHYADRPEIVDR